MIERDGIKLGARVKLTDQFQYDDVWREYDAKVAYIDTDPDEALAYLVSFAHPIGRYGLWLKRDEIEEA